MPLSEVLFEINDPVAAHAALKRLLETNGYTIKEFSVKKILGEHKLSVTRYEHKVEIDFDPPTNQCVPTTVTFRIDHADSVTYVKALFGKLSGMLPGMKLTSVKPDMSLEIKAPVTMLKPAEPLCQEISERKSWRCKNCGEDNNLAFDLCTHCGTKRHSVDEEEEFTDFEEDVEEDTSDSQDDQKDIYSESE